MKTTTTTESHHLKWLSQLALAILDSLLSPLLLLHPSAHATLVSGGSLPFALAHYLLCHNRDSDGLVTQLSPQMKRA